MLVIHAWVKRSYNVQNRPMDFNVAWEEEFIDIV
jgi:hypothetical protein